MVNEAIITKIKEFDSMIENSTINNLLFNILYKLELDSMLNQKGIDLFHNLSTFNFYKRNGEID